MAGGARAVIVDLDRSPGASWPTSWDAAIFVPGDVRSEDQVQAAVEAATNVGVLRVVVNCAGVATPGRVIGKRGVLPLADFRTVLDINLVGTFNVLRLAAAAMIDNEPLDGDRGLVIMTASGPRTTARLVKGLRGKQGRHRLAHPDRCSGPGRQVDPSHDHRPRSWKLP